MLVCGGCILYSICVFHGNGWAGPLYKHRQPMNKYYVFITYLCYRAIKDQMPHVSRCIYSPCIQYIGPLNKIFLLYTYIYIYLLKKVQTQVTCTFFNNYSNHPRMCVLSTLCGNVDKHSPLYMYIYTIHIYILYICISTQTWIGSMYHIGNRKCLKSRMIMLRNTLINTPNYL